MIKVHTANSGDLNAMYETELRTYDYPYDYAALKALLKDPDVFCVIAVTEKEHIIGYGAFRKMQNAEEVEVVRLGVLKKHRQQGAGKALLKAGNDYGITANMRTLYCIVPEVLCCPGVLDDQSQWLIDQGFTTTIPLLPQVFRMYGKWEDGVKFTRDINV